MIEVDGNGKHSLPQTGGEGEKALIKTDPLSGYDSVAVNDTTNDFQKPLEAPIDLRHIA